ncbi:LysR family transcriptional regulator [Salinibacterium hongtaonis]|uniref:LysR family transcriptional regulator n=1 Tax=Homoserinimonas hongtaonis TaxID=2079791 RepID=UPI000D386A94|nr:LysR family transcriptional regulator [Salinibacterium hongtaonis]AWB90224.1 LysR family transcriptional regulator [Salinibacterium hongtaonis]
MELRELRWFITLAETEHVTSAAAQLHISQPTLSRALTRLEKQLGVRLFDRRRNRLQLNKYGEIFLAHAIRALSEISQAEDRITTLVDPDRGVITLGFVESFGNWLVPRMVNRYREVAPGTSFELFGGAADAVVDGVRKGRFDIGLVSPRPAADDLQWMPIGRQSLRVAAPPGHRFHGRDSVALEDFADDPMVTLRVGYGLRTVIDGLFRDAAITQRIAIETTELSTLSALVGAGVGVAIVPEPPLELQPTPHSLPMLVPEAHREYGAIARQFGPVGSAAHRFLATLRADVANSDMYAVTPAGGTPGS